MFRPIIYTEFFLFGAISYLLGSVNFAIIFTKMFSGKDIRKVGSGNAGMTNVMRTAGMLPGVLTLLCDMGKAALAVVLGKYILTGMLVSAAPEAVEIGGLAPVYGAYFCGFCCQIGHIYPCFFNFRGGKGVAVTVGALSIIDWRLFLIMWGIFLIITFTSRMVSFGSVVTGILYPIVTFIAYYFGHMLPQDLIDAQNSAYHPFGIPLTAFATIGALAFAIVICIKHKANIKRILNGTEKKIFEKNKNKIAQKN